MAKVLLTFKTNYAKSTLFPTGILARWNFAFIDEIYEQFIPSILITSSLVLFGDKVTKILCNWYFVTKIVLTYCEKKLFQWSRKTFEIRGWKQRICKTFEVTRKIDSNSRSEQFWYQNAFLTCSWKFLRSNKLEFKFEKILGFRSIRKVWKVF